MIISNSFKCKVIIKQGEIVQPMAAVLDLTMLIVKLDSASQNPVTLLGFKPPVNLLVDNSYLI